MCQTNTPSQAREQCCSLYPRRFTYLPPVVAPPCVHFAGLLREAEHVPLPGADGLNRGRLAFCK